MHNTGYLKNGLTVVTLKMPRMKSAALGVWVRAGGRHEAERVRGVSHFLEHMAFKGTGKRSALEIKNTIEGIGGSMNAFTTEELTCYLAKVLKRHVSVGLDILGDMVTDPLFSVKDIKRERMVILEEVKMYRDQPDQYVHELLGGLLWPGHIMGMPLIGTTKSICRLSRGDIRAYHRAHYIPSNITVVACGDIDEAEVASACRKVFTSNPGQKAKGYERLRVRQSAARSSLFHKKTEQTHIAIGFHSPGRSSRERYVMNLLDIIIGANMSSRLFHEVREERGLAYAISSHTRFFEEGGVFTIDAGIDNSKVLKAISVILEELSKVKRGPIRKDEWRRAREYYQGHLAFTLEQTGGRMVWLGERLVTGDGPLDPRALLAKIRGISIDDMINLARTLFTGSNLNLALIGPVGRPDGRAVEDIVGSFR